MSSVTNHRSRRIRHRFSPARASLREFPDWFRDQQRAAWQQFESLPKPTRKDQAWRFSNVDLLDLSPFKISAPLSEDDRKNVLKYSRGLDQDAGRMIFANDQLIERDVVSEDLKKRGVIFQPLERAMVEHADLFRKYFMSTEATLGSAKFAALHKALVSSGTFLVRAARRRDRTADRDLPLVATRQHVDLPASASRHRRTGEGHSDRAFPIVQPDAPPGFACGVNDLIAGPGREGDLRLRAELGEQTSSRCK